MESIFIPLLYMPGQMVLTYGLLYFALPRFILKGKYLLAFIWIVIFCILAGFIGSFSYSASIDFIRSNFFHLIRHEPVNKASFEFVPFYFALSLRSAIGVAGFALAIKLIKYWYEKEYRNTMLQKEKLDAELQSLKAQLHPHFLFNTLNNIYSITQNSSPPASEMLVKLSGLLRYILYECDQPFVILSKEITMLKDYIELEKIRYSKNLELDISWPEDTNGYIIAPLLLLPLVENCFKHGSSRMLEQAWIKIQAELKENIFTIKLINGKPAEELSSTLNYGIGLGNVQKRLELLYPGKHEFKIISEQEVFIVNLRLELDKINGAANGQSTQ